MKSLIILALITLISGQIITTNFGCKSFAKDGVTCLECSKRFFKDSTGICQPVNEACKTYDQNTGACTGCYDGFLLIEVICIPDPKPQDPNCNDFSNGVCHKCSRGFYLLNNTCEMVSPLCKTFNYSTLLCQVCYAGYNLVNHTCQIAPPEGTMVGCSKYNGSVCLQCARDYFKNSNGVCVQVSSNCKTFDKTNGQCYECYPGWRLQNLTCVIQPSGTVDPNCKKFQNNTCVECSRGFYFDKNHICVEVSPFCKTFNFDTKLCVDCYSGFSLVNNNCIYDQNKPTYDVNCKTFDSKGVCQECSKGFYFAQGACTQVNPSCKEFDYTKIICTACYSGYSLETGVCIRTNSTGTTLKNCASELSGVCIKCVERAYYDINNDCVMVSDLCKEFNIFSGHCTSCYTGYALNQVSGECLPSNSAVCKKTDSKTNLCTECIKGYYLDTNSKCQQIDPECQTFNFNTRVCEQCYKGYVLNKNNDCEVTPVLMAPTVKNCVSYDSTGTSCVKCYDRFYLQNNECKQANPLCKTFNGSTGACVTCYTGFTLTKDGQCAFK